MQTLVHRRHETINKRFKQFGALKQVFRHDIGLHGKVFRSVAAITQLSIRNGEPLFSVDYKDPYLDDFYFDANEDGMDEVTEDL